jgi:hypothetical protein
MKTDNDILKNYKGANTKVPKSKTTSVITTTHEGKTISFRILSSTEIKATRNSAYAYLK